VDILPFLYFFSVNPDFSAKKPAFLWITHSFCRLDKSYPQHIGGSGNGRLFSALGEHHVGA